jgi:hypothetical protein
MKSALAGVSLSVARLRRPAATIAPMVALVFVLVAALLHRRVAPARAADHALVAAVFGLALPLLAYVTLTQLTSGARLEAALVPVARHGGNRRLSVAGVVLTASVWLAALGGVLAAVAVLCARGPSDPKLMSDLLSSTWLGALGGACYAAWFSLGSMLGKAGGGRLALLLLDWLLGAGSTALAAPWPRGHLRNLLGSEPVLHMPQWSALAVIVLLTISCATWAVMRTPD